MPNKSDFVYGFKSKAENLAIKYREELGLTKFKPLNAFILAKHLDIPIFSVEDAFKGNENHPDYLKLNNTDCFNALWMPNCDGDKIIIHNSNHSAFRQQSNLMHELAHIILDHKIPDEIAKICSLYKLHYYNKEQEGEAKFFGACLQITKPAVLWVLKENWTEERISQYYSASNEMVKYRLNVSGAKKIRQYLN